MTVRYYLLENIYFSLFFFLSESFLLSIVYTVIICFMNNTQLWALFTEFDTKVWSLVWADDERSSLHVYF